MKKIFVTVKEFRENGGELKEGRKIFMDNIGNKAAGLFMYNHKELRDVIVVDGFNLPTSHVYVQIDCTPHYV